MPYPDNIKTGGPFNQYRDIFSWWVAAINSGDEGEGFGPNFRQSIGNFFPLFPFTRAVFYDWLSSRWSEGKAANEIFIRSAPVNGWDVNTVNKWGKWKSMELAIFGNVSNGADIETMSLPHYEKNDLGYLGCLGYKQHSLAYMRYALTRFDYYGDCIVGNDLPPNTDGSGAINDDRYNAKTDSWPSIAMNKSTNHLKIVAQDDNWEIGTKVTNKGGGNIASGYYIVVGLWYFIGTNQFLQSVIIDKGECTPLGYPIGDPGRFSQGSVRYGGLYGKTKTATCQGGSLTTVYKGTIENRYFSTPTLTSLADNGYYLIGTGPLGSVPSDTSVLKITNGFPVDVRSCGLPEPI